LPYRELYRRRQAANGDFQPRSWYVDEALALPWVREIEAVASAEMPISDLRGFIVRHGLEAPNVLDHRYTIVVAEGMNEFSERMVVIKELMHCFFEAGDGTSTDSEIILEAHLRQFIGKSASTQSLHVQAEYTALWMAYGVLCPERRRTEFRNGMISGDQSLDDISNLLRIPPHNVRLLLSDQFEDEIRDILN
jgi:hypothetical protein